MKRVFNFSPGPGDAARSRPRASAQAELLDWQGSGMSVMEVSHRGKAFIEFAAQAEADLRELLGVPGELQGAVPAGRRHAAVRGRAAEPRAAPARPSTTSNTGDWSRRPSREAKRYVQRQRRGRRARRRSSRRFPTRSTLEASRPSAAYLHYTPNETSAASSSTTFPTSATCRWSRTCRRRILSRPIDVEQFGLIYAGAQKNIGPAGLAS